LAFARYFHEQHQSDVVVVHAQHFEPPPYFSSGQLEKLKREYRKSIKAGLEQVCQTSESILGFTPEVSVIEGNPVEIILAAAARGGIDMIVMGTHGRRGAERIWLGSVAERVLRGSLIPVLAVRGSPEKPQMKRIFCPVNQTEVSQIALQYAAQISKANKGHLTVLHVAEKPDLQLDCPLVGDEVRRECAVEEMIVKGNASKEILEKAGQVQPDLIVMGAERKSGVWGELFSSTTESVMQSASVPVLVVPKTEQ
jgi:nucleotide-binding universal stress UspA family protein